MRRRSENTRRRSSTKANTNRRLEEHKKGFVSTTIKLPEGAEFFKLKDKKTKYIDILKYEVGHTNPYADAGSMHWELTFWVHKNLGPDGNLTLVCPAMAGRSNPTSTYPGYAVGGKHKCVVCAEIERLAEDYQENEDLIKAWRLQERQLFNVVDLNEQDKGVQIWDISNFLFGELLDTELRADREEDEEYQEFSEWDERGNTIRMTIEQGCFNRKETFKPKTLTFRHRKEGYENAKDMVYCLEDLLIVPSSKEIEKVFTQAGDSTNNHEQQFRSTDVKKIKEMTDRELQKFIVINDMDIDPDDYDDLKDLKNAAIAMVKDAIGDDEKKPSTKKKSAKKTSKRGKQKPTDDDFDDEESEPYVDDDAEEFVDEDEDLDDEDEDLDDEDEDLDDEDEDLDDEDEDLDDEDEDLVDEDEDLDDEDEDLDDEDESPARRKKASKKSSKKTSRKPTMGSPKKSNKETSRNTKKKTSKKTTTRRRR